MEYRKRSTGSTFVVLSREEPGVSGLLVKRALKTFCCSVRRRGFRKHRVSQPLYKLGIKGSFKR